VRLVGAGEVSALRLRRLIERDGGFTLDLPTGRRVSHGISVCSRPWRSLRFRCDEWDDALVDRWLAAINVEGRRTRHVGGWLDARSDHVWLDLVRVVPPTMRPVACAVARVLRQHCVFDLGRRELVTVGRQAA
jgi:hypothetical protein